MKREKEKEKNEKTRQINYPVLSFYAKSGSSINSAQTFSLEMQSKG